MFFKKKPKDHLELALKASNYKLLGNSKKAIKYAQMSIDIEPKNHIALDTLATSYRLIGNFEMSKKYFAILMKIFDDEELIELPLPNIYLSFNMWKSVFYMNYANLFHTMSDFDQAFEYYQISLDIAFAELAGLNQDTAYMKEEIHEHIAQVYRNIARTHRELNSDVSAINSFQESLNFQQKAVAYEDIVHILVNLKEYRQALNWVNKAFHNKCISRNLKLIKRDLESYLGG